MSLYSDPPPLNSFDVNKPTLLVCWWITIFCTVIIGLRVTGRLIRSERLFAEDKTVSLALIPLYLRMGCVHVILIYGTNNAQLTDAGLSDEEIRKKSIASGLVLLSRIFYAATLWVLKNTILEFFKRLNVHWERSYEVTLLFIRCTLGATFIAIVISDLAECQPFSNYWQVLPDPGGQCRQGYAQLITMATCNVITDLLLVILPIPVILSSTLSFTRKVQLVLLFSLSLSVVGVTLYRVPHIIRNHGSQQSRSLYASIELLFATAAANALVLGSFVRDRGTKKRRWKYGSVAAGSMEQSSRTSVSHRGTIVKYWGASDEDLVRDTGLGVAKELRDQPDSPTADAEARRFYRPAPVAALHQEMSSWRFPDGDEEAGPSAANTSANGNNSDNNHEDPKQKRVSDDTLLQREQTLSSRSNSTITPRRVSFFDVGGLLADEKDLVAAARARRDSVMSMALDPASPPPQVVPASTRGSRRGSTAFLQDIGGLLTVPPLSSGLGRMRSRSVAGLETIQQQQQQQREEAQGAEEAKPPIPESSTPSATQEGEQAGNEGEPEPTTDAGGLLEPKEEK